MAVNPTTAANRHEHQSFYLGCSLELAVVTGKQPVGSLVIVNLELKGCMKAMMSCQGSCSI